MQGRGRRQSGGGRHRAGRVRGRSPTRRIHRGRGWHAVPRDARSSPPHHRGAFDTNRRDAADALSSLPRGFGLVVGCRNRLSARPLRLEGARQMAPKTKKQPRKPDRAVEPTPLTKPAPDPPPRDSAESPAPNPNTDMSKGGKPGGSRTPLVEAARRNEVRRCPLAFDDLRSRTGEGAQRRPPCKGGTASLGIPIRPPPWRQPDALRRRD